MPTISQLPPISSVGASDLVPVSQDGVACSVSIGGLLAGTQPAIQADTGTLLGRVSVGPGGPEQIELGAGLAIRAGVLAANGVDHADFPEKQDILPEDQVVLSSGSGPALLPVTALRRLFAAGANINITSDGLISATGSVSGEGPAIGVEIAGLSSVSSAGSQDMIAISQNGSTWSISVGDLLDGQTIGEAVAAGPASDGDTLWVAQGDETMVRQTLGAVWPWLVSKLPAYLAPVAELVSDTTLDVDQHNGRLLVCSSGLTLSVPSEGMPSGFQCDIINLSSSDVALGAGIRTSSGNTALAAGVCARMLSVTYSAGSLIYAWLNSSSTLPSVPSQIIDLSASPQSPNSIALSWSAPSSSGIDLRYLVQYRVAGTAGWTTLASNVLASPYVVGTLSPAVSYDFIVAGTTASLAGVPSNIATAATFGSSGTISPPTNLSATNIATNSLTLSWKAPSTGSAQSYGIQYRVTGGTVWTGNVAGLISLTYAVSGLTSNQSYEFEVTAVGSSGESATSSPITATTLASGGSVTSISWNLVPTNSFEHGSGSIGVNAHVAPVSASVRFGLSPTTTVRPTAWTVGTYVNTDLWGAYVPTPTSAGTWYIWAEGLDGSSATFSSAGITVV